tara:strand:- start:853 stop:1695 length:843 start_codon:yes stop_codon:yes gene_type:complete
MITFKKFSNKFKFVLEKILYFKKKSYLKLNFYIKTIKYNSKEVKDKQIQCYLESGLDRDRGLKKLNYNLDNLNFQTYDESNEMYSEHLIIFAAIADKYQNRIKNILEIGTFDGKTSRILSSLFPLSKVNTIDLKDNDPIFINSYGRENIQIRNSFIEKRNELLNSAKNIYFWQFNSLNIMKTEIAAKEYDLIWIDGAHGYPFACADIVNSFSLAHKDTLIMCDDVWEKVSQNDKFYKSDASFKTINEFEKANLLSTNYIRKRIGKKFVIDDKYICLCKLI